MVLKVKFKLSYACCSKYSDSDTLVVMLRAAVSTLTVFMRSDNG